MQNPGQAVSILLRGSNKLVLDEAERSLHDALCVLRCLVKKRMLVSGGCGALFLYYCHSLCNEMPNKGL